MFQMYLQQRYNLEHLGELITSRLFKLYCWFAWIWKHVDLQDVAPLQNRLVLKAKQSVSTCIEYVARRPEKLSSKATGQGEGE